MRKDIHPEDYRFVVFKDMTNDYAFLCRSSAASTDTVTWEDGNEYPLVKLDISHKSHPFFTGMLSLWILQVELINSTLATVVTRNSQSFKLFKSSLFEGFFYVLLIYKS